MPVYQKNILPLKKFGGLLFLTKWLNWMVNKINDEGTAEKILVAAKSIFIVKGMAGARMQDIADEAGINKALLHYYFRNKEQLFETIFLEEAKKFFPKINMIFESELPLFEKIEKFTGEYIDEIMENPYLPLFVLNQINLDPDKFMYKILGKANLPRPQKFLAQIEQDTKKGKIRPINPVHLLMNLLSMCIFPFIAKPMFMRNLGMSESQFRQIMEQRKKEVPMFIINSIKK